MRLLAALVVSVALVTPAPKKHKPKPCSHGSAIERRHCHAHRLCSNARPRWCVENAIVHSRRWMQSWQKAWMRRVPWCESRWNAGATGGPNAGLYQFNVGTWAALPRRFSSHSPYEARYAALAAAFMVHSGRTGEWACR